MRMHSFLSAITFGVGLSLCPLLSQAADAAAGAIDAPIFSYGGSTPYSGVWSWEKDVDAEGGKEATVKLTAGKNSTLGKDGTGPAGTFPWWHVLLLQGHSNQETMRMLVQSILTYLAQLEVAHDEKDKMQAPSTPLIATNGSKLSAGATVVEKNITNRLPGVTALSPNVDLYSLPPAANNSFAIHIQRFCTEAEFTAGICFKEDPDLLKSTVSERPGADLKADSLLKNDVLEGTIDQEAALNFIQHVFPVKTIRAPLEMKKDKKYKPASIANLQMQWSGVARQSLGENIFYRFYYERVPIAGLKMPGAAADSKDISLKQLIRHEATWRFESDNWKKAINGSSTNALLREMANMEAFRMYLEYQQLQRMEEITALLAVMVVNTNSNYMGDMAKAKVEEALAPFNKPDSGYNPFD